MAAALYAAKGAAATASDLYSVDPLTGATTSIGALSHAVTGLAFDPTDPDSLYAATSSNSTLAPRSLLRITLAAGIVDTVTLVGGFGVTIADIAFDDAGQLYGWHQAGANGQLATINKATAAVVDVGASGLLSSFGNGMDIDAAGVLYAILQNTSILFSVNLSTGVAATVFNPTDESSLVLAGQACQAASFDEAGTTLWAVYAAQWVATLNISTGVWTNVGALGSNNWDALAWSADVTPPPPPTPVFGRSRYQTTPPWRIIVGDLEDNTLTFLDRLALDRSVTVTRAAARVISGRVPSDNPEVNIPAPPPDSEPFVSEGVRLVSCFRREAPSGSHDPPWVIRARGLLLSLTDDADSDHATSTFTAYDPWKYWYRRPILNDTGDVTDFNYAAGARASEIILDQFSKALAFGDTLFTDFGQTGFYAGTIESTDPIADGGDGFAMKFAAGTTLGEMCDQLVATGTCDIVNDPIYDIANRPGLLTETSVYVSAGEFRANAVMGWDRWPRSLVQLSRQVEGTERANQVQMYAGQGGPAVSLQTDAASLARFGEYWALQYLPGVPSLAGAHLIAQRQLALLKDGQYTYSLSPAAERAPLLFEEYREADTVPVYADQRFRDPISGLPVRIEAIPIVIGDDEQERVNQILVSFAPESAS